MTKQCPFRLSGAPPPPQGNINPNDGTWLWVTNSPWTADNTGATDASGDIQACIDAAATAGKNVWCPAGTYKLNSGIGAPSEDTSYNDMLFAGAGIGTTTFVVPNTYDDTAMYWYMISGVHLSDFTLYTAEPSGTQAIPNGIYFTGMQNSSIRRVRLDNFKDAIRLAGVYDEDPTAKNLLIEDITTRGSTDLSFQVICVENSIFRRLDLENTVNSGSGMCIYDERRNHNNQYIDVECTGGYRSCFQFSNDYENGGSGNITVDGLTLNMATTVHDNYALTFYAVYYDGRHSGITINDVVFNITPSNTECIRWYGQVDNVVIDGVTAAGGKCLNAGYDGNTEVTNCQIKNGTYDGSYINWLYPSNGHGAIPGLTVSNITLT